MSKPKVSPFGEDLWLDEDSSENENDIYDVSKSEQKFPLMVKNDIELSSDDEQPLSKEEQDALYDDLADDQDEKWATENLESKFKS
jgi:hypothetical protein